MKLLLHVCMVRARRPPPPPRSGWGYARNGASRPFGGRKLGFPGFLDMPSTTSAPPQRSTQCLKNTSLQFPKVQYGCTMIISRPGRRGRRGRTSCANEGGIRGGAGSNPRPIRSDRDRPPTCISDRNAVPMVAMGPFRSPLRPGWVTGSARLSGGCAAHARSSGARRVAELRALRRTGRLSPAHNFAKANLHVDQRDVDAPSGPNVRFFLSAARA